MWETNFYSVLIRIKVLIIEVKLIENGPILQNWLYTLQ